MIKELVGKDHEALKTVLPRFDFDDPPCDPIELAHDLAQTMLQHGGMGLAANQVGLPYRVFVIRADPILACFNPLVLDETAQTKVTLDEGCLSYPGLFLPVSRPAKIKVRYTQPNGEVVTTHFTGMTARVFQHEMDHMEGRNFTQRVSRLKLDMAKKKAKRLNEDRTDLSGMGHGQ